MTEPLKELGDHLTAAFPEDVTKTRDRASAS